MPSSPYQRLPEGVGQSSSPASSIHTSDGALEPAFAKPATYYGEGPFDPPSSDDEDDNETESLLEKHVAPSSPGLAELGDRFPSGSGQAHETDDSDLKKRSSLRFFAILLAAVLLLSAVVGIIAAQTYKGTPQHRPGTRKFTIDHVFNGTFNAQRKTINWVQEAGDGVYSVFEAGDLKLVDLKTNTTKVLVSSKDIKDQKGNLLMWYAWDLSPDMKYILLKADYRKQWRWSSFGNYYVHNIEAKTTHPLIPPTHPSATAYATWAPTGQSIAYVTDNDLYVLTNPSATPIRVTASGNASLFHGVPDWVYEEEIFSADFALWWSPDAKKVAFLVFDETAVEEYNFPIYNPTGDNNAVIPYTSDIVMKYPKPGYNNPLVSVHVFDVARHAEDAGAETDFAAEEHTYELEWPHRHAANDSIISQVKWVGDAALILKEVNRNADDGNVVLFNLDDAEERARSRGKVVRKLGKKGEQGDNGWIDHDQSIHRLPASLTPGETEAYLDIVPTPEGYNHIALFSPASSGTPHFLTSGKWEVTNGIKGIDVKKGVVYFEAANPSSIERHVYSTPLPKDVPFKAVEATALTDVTKQAYYSTNFSPGAGFYVLDYQGPTIPWQKIIAVGNSTFEHSLTNNEYLTNVTMEYEAPTISHSKIMSDGYELNVQEIRPPRMDDSGRVKYPVLFRVYGGPQSQLVDLKFTRNWHDYLACGLSYIVVTVDGRGTGFKGRHLRNPVKDNLGFYETIDQINAAKIWAAKEYVDRKRIGIWGWSYGGFMASKVVEANAGVHSLSMAVAPVTSWRLYDSIYTERYMNLPQLNPGGYVNASISNVTGFHNVDYLLAHGSGDDNVHYANSAHLLDMFTKAQVRNFRFRMFTDSDHSISRRGANREVYQFLTDFLIEKWGKGGRRRGW
ncbi:dipeptidyl aminopeptidase [Lyophyllum atratum]|nr:dipeptidyl aminopeptidase [Lyophyllum atratum]